MTDYPATFAHTWPDLSLRRLDATRDTRRPPPRRPPRPVHPWPSLLSPAREPEPRLSVMRDASGETRVA